MFKNVLLSSVCVPALVVIAADPSVLAVNMVDMAYLRYEMARNVSVKAHELAEVVEQAEAMTHGG